MLKPDILSLGAILLLAGCSTKPPSAATDWCEAAVSKPVEIEHVSEPAPVATARDIVPAPAAPATNSARAEEWISLVRWAAQAGVELQPSPAPPVRGYSLGASNGTVQLQINSLQARWNGVEFRLGHQPQLFDGQPWIHALDLKKNIEPLLASFGPVQKTDRVLVIDPGHGGGNGGTSSVLDGAAEKEFTLDWALRIAEAMATNGWRVILTRTNDVEMPLSARVAVAEEHKADLFISLHFNSAAPSREQAGLETYCLTPSGLRSTLTRGYEDDSSLVFPNNTFDAGNLQHAMLLHTALLKECGFADRGVRRARFLGVLRGQNRPAVLIEAGYLSNPEEAARIADPDFRQKLAEAVAGALK